MRKTKIICTIGPAVSSLEMIEQLIQAGMDVARLNFSHGTHETHLEVINRIKEARRKAGKPVAIMLDTKGPEIRIGSFLSNSIYVKRGDRALLLKEQVEGNAEAFSVIPGEVLNVVDQGVQILFDDGYISSHVKEVRPEGVVVEFDNEGLLKTSKGVNIPNVKTQLPPMSERDREDIRFGCDQDVDIIAASFVRSAEAVIEIKNFLDELNKNHLIVFAKIENNEGIENFDSIIQVADGVMIARGDLGVEVPISKVPRLQKMMIRKSYLAGKPSVTATQMLESMINHPRPTRAEVSDVANAIYDGTSAVMLSGETAVGTYPIETVQVMQKIIQEAEKDFQYRLLFEQHAQIRCHDVPSSVTLASVKTAYSSDAKAIFAFTNSGATARLLSRLRPEMPIIALTPSEKSYYQMAINWGVHPILSETYHAYDEAFKSLCEEAKKSNIVSTGDLVVVTAGSPFGFSGTTNTMIVENIGDVLLRGISMNTGRVHKKVLLLHSWDQYPCYCARDRIVVLSHCNPDYAAILLEASGIILQNAFDDKDSVKYLEETAKELSIPAIANADGAFNVLKEGQLITLDAEKALVYKGVTI